MLWSPTRAAHPSVNAPPHVLLTCSSSAFLTRFALSASLRLSFSRPAFPYTVRISSHHTDSRYPFSIPYPPPLHTPPPTPRGLSETTVIAGLTFKEKFQLSDKAEFLRLLFETPEMHQLLSLGGEAAEVSHSQLATETLSMTFFDRIEENGLLSVGGNLKKCYDEYYDGVLSSDLLHECVLNEDSEHYYTFSEEDRREFIYRIFHHLVVGGGLCQSEEKVDEYLRLSKEMYKEFVAVRKSAATGKVRGSESRREPARGGERGRGREGARGWEGGREERERRREGETVSGGRGEVLLCAAYTVVVYAVCVVWYVIMNHRRY